MAQYIVQQGQNIYDVCYNANGSLKALNDNLTLNNILTYTPVLQVSDILIVSDDILNNATIQTSRIHAFNSYIIPDEKVDKLIADLENKLISQQYISFTTSLENDLYTSDGLQFQVKAQYI